MDASNPILFYWKKEQKVFEKNLSILRLKLDKEAIHDLRVAVKKLSAYLELYILLQKETSQDVSWEENLLRNTRELFDINGRQRDVEMCLELLPAIKKETRSSLSQFILYLQAVLKISKAWSVQAIHHYNNRELSKTAFLFKQDEQNSDAGDINEKILSVVNKQIAELITQFRKPHKLRKALKLIYYWLDLLNNNDRYQPGTLHTILDDLGQWQDYEVLLTKLKHFRKDYLPKPFDEYEDIKKLETGIIEKKKTLVKHARNKTRQWVDAVGLK